MFEVNISEMHHLANMLGSTNIPYEIEELWGGLHISYPNKTDCVCSVICHSFSYGGRNGLLEIMGLTETEDGDVEGYLTSQQVYNRIAMHFLQSGQIRG